MCSCFENYDAKPFHFDIAKMVVDPSAGAAKGSGGKDVRTTDSPSL
jgi:hypothetical protein